MSSPFPFRAPTTLSAQVAATVAVMRSYHAAAPVDVHMDMGELEESMDRMDIDNAADSLGGGEDMDLLAMDLDVAFQGLGTITPAPPTPFPPTSPSPSTTSFPTRPRSQVKYYYNEDPFNEQGRLDFGRLRRNIRHIDSVVRNLATEPYDTRGRAVRELYRPFVHMTRTLASLKNRGRDSLTESHAQVGKYIRHMRNLKSIVSALGSEGDESRSFKNAVDKLERTHLPAPRIIKLRVLKRGSDTTNSTSTNSSTGSSAGSQGAAADQMDIDDNMDVTRLSQRLRRFRMD